MLVTNAFLVDYRRNPAHCGCIGIAPPARDTIEAPLPAWPEHARHRSAKYPLMGTSDIKRFGRYEILVELGRGAMGVVYKARDPQIDRLVAVKTVSLRGQEPEQQDEFRQRFMYEAQAAGRLHHPGIVTIFDVGEDPETHDSFIVLEYVAGESLSRILSREKKLSLPRALQLAEELAEALDYAHAQGVVHRDIKPANILMTEDGHAKIADFGIAKLNLAHFTLPGRLLGTPAYMAPEQLVGEGSDGRSDLFSLGVILYAMVTGHSPFHGNSATTVCYKVVNRDPVPATAFDLELPRSLDPVISRAMAKDPADRYQRGAEFASDLHQLRLEFTASTNSMGIRISNATGTLKALAPVAKADPPKGLEPAQHLVQTAIGKAPLRDLIWGAALVLVLIIIAIPSRKAATSQKAEPATPATVAVSVSQPSTEDSKQVAVPVQTADSTASPAHARTRVRTKILRPATTHQSSESANPERQVLIPDSTLQLAVQHQFKEALLSVWIDDKLALTCPLRGGAQKRLVLFNGVRGTDSETLQVPAGKHLVRLRAQSSDQSINLSRTISAEFIGGTDRTLQVTFDKHNTDMHLTWQ
jgi:serine/threonine protein kinase